MRKPDDLEWSVALFLARGGCGDALARLLKSESRVPAFVRSELAGLVHHLTESVAHRANVRPGLKGLSLSDRARLARLHARLMRNRDEGNPDSKIEFSFSRGGEQVTGDLTSERGIIDALAWHFHLSPSRVRAIVREERAKGEQETS